MLVLTRGDPAPSCSKAKVEAHKIKSLVSLPELELALAPTAIVGRYDRFLEIQDAIQQPLGHYETLAPREVVRSPHQPFYKVERACKERHLFHVSSLSSTQTDFTQHHLPEAHGISISGMVNPTPY
jgi:hypothetical protein